jgi:YNFM family putative membrane transporter
MTEDFHIERHTRAYYKANIALFIAGFITFSTLYDVQPLLPVLSSEFNISPTAGSLILSVATFALAWTLPISGSISDAIGRKVMMTSAVVLTALLALASSGSDSLWLLLALRFIQGLVLAGVPAVAMAYLGEEIAPRAIGPAMGLYIAGNAMGGMSGRMLTTWIADLSSWRVAIASIGGLSLVLSIVVLLILPPSRHFIRRDFHLRPLTASLFAHLKNRQLCCLFAVAFLIMGSFVTLYNYVNFMLLAPPYDLAPSTVAWIFISYAFGAVGSTMMGGVVERLGLNRAIFLALEVMVLGALLTLIPALTAIALGIVVFTIGFFGVHATASAWVGQLTTVARAQASSLYLFFYYLGSSLSGTGGGLLWSRWGWIGVVCLILLLLGCAALVLWRLVCLDSAAKVSVN